MMYVHIKVWLRTPQGVTEWSLDELNKRIDYWNQNLALHQFGTFWGWLSVMEEETYLGFYSSTWRVSNKVHAIMEVK